MGCVTAAAATAAATAASATAITTAATAIAGTSTPSTFEARHERGLFPACQCI